MGSYSKFKTRKEIVIELGISYKTLVRFIKKEKIPIEGQKLLSPKEYILIYQKYFPSREMWPSEP